ncbi:MAG: 50S ribosomal protein L22 [Thermoprotei archaeon]|nr:MAG: 50S ribosomal protein L22 [Thermoprotei archaeon]
MPTFGYSVKELDPDKTCLASGRDLRVSFKKMVELCASIRGLKLEEAEKLLEDVIAKRRMIPFRRFKKKRAHHGSIDGYPAGGYPVKAAKELLKVLKNAENNAENKGLDASRLYVKHAAAQKGFKIRKYIPRAFGRATPYFQELTHVEVALEER